MGKDENGEKLLILNRKTKKTIVRYKIFISSKSNKYSYKTRHRQKIIKISRIKVKNVKKEYSRKVKDVRSEIILVGIKVTIISEEEKTLIGRTMRRSKEIDAS